LGACWVFTGLCLYGDVCLHLCAVWVIGVFMVIQLSEYGDAWRDISFGACGVGFYFLTGLHGCHVCVGVLGIEELFRRDYLGCVVGYLRGGRSAGRVYVLSLRGLCMDHSFCCSVRLLICLVAGCAVFGCSPVLHSFPSGCVPAGRWTSARR